MAKGRKKENVVRENIKKRKNKLQKLRIVGFIKNNTKEEREAYNDFRDFRMIHF